MRCGTRIASVVLVLTVAGILHPESPPSGSLNWCQDHMPADSVFGFDPTLQGDGNANFRSAILWAAQQWTNAPLCEFEVAYDAERDGRLAEKDRNSHVARRLQKVMGLSLHQGWRTGKTVSRSSANGGERHGASRGPAIGRDEYQWTSNRERLSSLQHHFC
jgi:hypothetical protein